MKGSIYLKKTELETELKKRFFDVITKALTEQGEEILQIDKATFCIPTLDADGNEAWVRVKVDIPHGQRGGDAFDGYAEKENFLLEMRMKAEKNARIAEEKARKIERDKKRREQLKEQREKAKAEKGE